jgi:transcriptional regulator GlxA family with amidase domain
VVSILAPSPWRAAGVLEGYRATVHWETIGVFRELYPNIAVSEQLYVVDRHRITCAGGTATLDLMLYLIGTKCGRNLAQIVANGFVHGRRRHDAEQQRVSADDAFGHADPRLARVIQAMEANIEAPLSEP